MQDFPDSLRRFLTGRIDSLEQLEVVLYLHRIYPAAAVVDEIGAALGVGPSSLARALNALVEQGLVGKDGERWRFAPADESVRARVHELAEVYSRRRLEVVNAVSAKAIARVQALADAFSLRTKDKPK